MTETDPHTSGADQPAIAMPSGDGGSAAPADLDLPPEFSALESVLVAAAEDEEGFSPLELDDRVVISLLFNERIRIEQVKAAWVRARTLEQAGAPARLWRVLAQDPEIDRAVVFEEAAQAFAFKSTTVNKYSALACLRKASDLFPRAQWERMQALRVLPVSVAEEAREGGGKDRPRRAGAPKGGGRPARRWLFVSHDPTNPDIQRFLKDLGLQYYDLQYAPEPLVESLVAETRSMRNEYLERVHDADLTVDLDVGGAEDEQIKEEELEAEINRSALINLFEASLIEAVRRGASDIHICPDEGGHIAIHFRVDGELACWYVEEKALPEAFLAVAKDRTRNVDRFERDRGQDGYLQRTVDGVLIRFRVSILPIAHANQQARYESIVIRVLDDRKVLAGLADLSLPEGALHRLQEAIQQPQGMVILTGPTGSGKSTTLYAALQEVRSPKRNILTAEDPVEYVLPGIRQVKISHKLQVNEALRFILRHDPDVVMVGEMRDKDTAELGIQLANTGHLTFSTLHTNDAPSAVSRLYKMGLEPFLIAHSVTLVVAQRLVRALCPSCKRRDEEQETEELQRLGFTTAECAAAPFYRAGEDADCRHCAGHGYKGRRAIVEVMPMTRDARRLIVGAEGSLDEDALRSQAIADGMVPLTDAARMLVVEGETSTEEMVRVVGVPR